MAKQPPAWERVRALSEEINEALIGAAQCRNHLQATLASWNECDDAERRLNIEEALERLTRAGV